MGRRDDFASPNKLPWVFWPYCLAGMFSIRHRCNVGAADCFPSKTQKEKGVVDGWYVDADEFGKEDK